jgi:hypothetical protein
VRPGARLLALLGRSEVASVFRGGLVGLAAALEDALARAVDDPGSSIGQAVLDEVRRLLAERSTPPVPSSIAGTDPPRPTVGASQRVDERLQQVERLAAEFVTDARIRPHLDARSVSCLRGPSSASTDHLWRTLQLRLLRLPRPLASEWRERTAVLADDSPSPDRWTVVPAPDPVVLIPPLAPDGEGLRADVAAPLAPDVRAVLATDPDRPGLLALAGAATTILTIAGLDDQLFLGLESLQFHGLRRLDANALAQYRDELTARLSDLVATDPGGDAELEALIEVDEAIASVVHRPPAADTSWWAGLSGSVRDVLAAHAAQARASGQSVDVRPLVLRYRDVSMMSGGNDVPVQQGGEPGEVVACLRVWARLGQRELPGRVMYRA